MAVTVISICVMLSFTLILMVSNNLSIVDALFEVSSAIGTVGLSRNITSTLNSFGKILIIITMYLGRIGPISMFIAFSKNGSSMNNIRYSEADITIG